MGLVLVLAGCGGQSGNEDLLVPWCEEASREAIALDAIPAELALPPQYALDAMLGEWAGTLDTGVAEPATLTVTHDGVTAEYVQWVRVTDPGPDAEGESCPKGAHIDYELPVHLRLTAGEGLLDEDLDVTVLVPYGERPTLDAGVAVEALVGSARPPWDTTEFDTNELMVQLAWGLPDDLSTGPEWVVRGSADWYAERAVDAHTSNREGEPLGTLYFEPADDAR